MSGAKQMPQIPGDFGYYEVMLPLHQILPINQGLRSASANTMTSLLGAPGPNLTYDDEPEKASQRTKDLLDTRQLSPHITVRGIKPALESLAKVLQRTFATEAASGHDLEAVLGSAGMLSVRLSRPTDGSHSNIPSNHSWGCAIDFALLGQRPPGNTHDMVPRFIAALIPAMNTEGWFAGMGFRSPDAMHFEVAEETIQDWSSGGLLKP